MGACNSHRSSFHRSPITIPIIRKFIHSLSDQSFSTYQSLLVSSIFTLAFYSFLRVGEFTLSPHTLHLADCQLSPGSSLLLSFCWFKFSHNSSPHLIIPAAHHDLCPVNHSTCYLSLHLFLPFWDHFFLRNQVNLWTQNCSLFILPLRVFFQALILLPLSLSFRIGANTTAGP